MAAGYPDLAWDGPDLRCRSLYPAAGRYWEKHLEIDLVCPDPDDADGLLVGEAKWKRLTQLEQARVLHDLDDKCRSLGGEF